MRSISKGFTALVPAMLLAACRHDAPAPAASVATLDVNPASIELVAGSGTAADVTVTNTSSNLTVTAVSAALPAGWSDVAQDAGGCATLAPQASCVLTFTPGSNTHPATAAVINGNNAAPTSVTLQVSQPNSANISAASGTLSLVAGSGTAAGITVTNHSTILTATGITVDLSGTPLDGQVTVDASGCASVAPGASCSLQFTPGNTAVSATAFPIQGTNTSVTGGTIAITLPTSAAISVSGSPLVLTASYGTPAAGTLTVTNNSTVLTAANITAVLTGTALAGAVSQDASGCTSVAPGASCTLSFTPTGTTAIAATAVVVQGANTSQAGASIAVNAPTPPTLSISGSPLTLYAGGTSGSVTVTNTSTAQAALNIQATINGTPLAGDLAVASTTCTASLAPQSSCMISFAPGSTVAAQTGISIAGSNTNTVTAQIGITVLAGQSYAGGIVYQINADGASGMVVSAADVSSDDVWGGTGTATGATSDTDGATNTATIVSVLGTGSSYAALDCYDYTGSDASAAAGTWYLPAVNELIGMLTSAQSAGVSNFAAAYWSSTEDLTDPSGYGVFVATSDLSSGSYSKALSIPVRCIRAF